MDTERIEHELSLLNGRSVTIVRPFFGLQSDAFLGFIFTDGNSYPLHFQFKSMGCVILFTAEDVTSVEMGVIRLKGPTDYAAKLVHA